MNLMKKGYRFFLWILLSLLLICCIIYIVSWRSPRYFIASYKFDTNRDSIIPFINYSSIIDHPRPYIINSKDNFTVFGASHTRDPNNSEIALIENEWRKLNPTIVLVEGRLGFLIPGLMNPVKYLGEGGKVKFLAEKENIPLYNWDLPKETLAKMLIKSFNPEQVALAQILNPYFSELRFGKPDSPEKYIAAYFNRAEYVGQENNIKTVMDIDRLWEKYFPNGENWRNINDQYGLPGFLDKMACYSNDLRNQQLVASIKELITKGEKVFVICGSSHAVCISIAFKDIK
jgi:hypothetical protein